MSDTEETNPLTAELMYGGTVRDLQLQIARSAQRGETVFGRVLVESATPMTKPESELSLMAHVASFHGWALVALLSMLSAKDPALANKAANIVQDIGANGGGGWEDWGQDIYEQIMAEESAESAAVVAEGASE